MPFTLLPPPVTREDFLSRRLDSLRGYFRRVVFTRAACRCFVVAVLAVGLIGWLDHRYALPALVRAYALVGLITAVLFLFHRWLVKPLRGSGDPDRLATLVERRYPDFNDSFRSAVNFLNHDADRPTCSPDLRKAVIRRAVRKLEHHDLRDAVDRRGTMRALFGAMALAGVMGWCVIVQPDAVLAGAKRLTEPFGGSRPQQQTTLEIVSPASFPHRMARGEALELKVRVGGSISDRITLVIQPDGLPSVEQQYTVPDDAPANEPITLRIEPSRIPRSFQFRVKANDADTGWRSVTVSPPPVLVPFNGRPSPQFHLEYPAYTDLPDADLPDGGSIIECIAGTRLTLRAATDRPVAKAWIIHRPENPLSAQLTMLSVLGGKPAAAIPGFDLMAREVWAEIPLTIRDGALLEATFVPRVSGPYVFRFEDETGLGTTRLLDLRVHPDPAPAVTLERAINGRDQMIALPEAEIHLPVRAQDKTYAIRRVWLEYRINSERAVRMQMIYDPGQLTNLLPLLLNLKPSTTNFPVPSLSLTRMQQLAAEPMLALASVRTEDGRPLREGDMLTLHAVADDFDDVTGFKEPGRSTELRIAIVSKQDVETIVQQTQSEVRDQLARLRQLQQEAKTKVEQAAKTPEMKPAEMDKFAEAEQTQDQIRNKVEQGEESIRATIDKLRQQLKENKVPDSLATERLDEAAKELARLADREFEPLAGDFAKAKREPDPKARKATLDKIAERQRGVEKTFKELVERLEPWSGAGEIRGDARNLSQDIKRQADQTNQLGGKIPENTPPEKLDPMAKAELDKAIQNAERLSDQARELIEKMNRLAVEKEMSAGEKIQQSTAAEKQAADLKTQAAKEPKGSPKERDLANQIDEKTREAGDLRETAADLQREAAALRQAGQAGNSEELKEQLRQAAQAAKQNQLNRASQQQQAAKENVDRLLKNLRQTDEQNAERLQKKTEQAKADLDKILDEQERLQKKIDDAEKIPDETLRRETLKKLAAEQEQLEKQTRELAQRLNRQQAEQPAERLRRAANEMAKAREQLQEGQSPGDKTDEALERLDDAKLELEQAKGEQEEKLNREQQAELADQIRALKERQERMNAEATRIHQVVKQAKKWERPMRASQNDLRQQQAKLGEEAETLIEKEFQKIPVFGRMLRQAAGAMKLASKRMDARLEAAESGPFDAELEDIAELSTRSQQILAKERLEQLLDALKPDAQPKPESMAAPPPGGGPMPPAMGGDEPKKPKLPPLAQLKALRNLQADIGVRTHAFDKAHPDRTMLNDDDADELMALEQMQRDIADLIKELTADAPGEMP
ncbi:hypothetical protein [Zavarzinella formosa]|uniref:hypothetical protein n=1 Tax=Zavarzinella formosa TaxID=360055 RepID=UPI0003763DD1|nr:hypothetical protein [Zavarzinella formosa]